MIHGMKVVDGNPGKNVAHYHKVDFLCPKCIESQQGLVLCLNDLNFKMNLRGAFCMKCNGSGMTVLKVHPECHVPTKLDGSTFTT